MFGQSKNCYRASKNFGALSKNFGGESLKIAGLKIIARVCVYVRMWVRGCVRMWVRSPSC